MVNTSRSRKLFFLEKPKYSLAILRPPDIASCSSTNISLLCILRLSSLKRHKKCSLDRIVWSRTGFGLNSEYAFSVHQWKYKYKFGEIKKLVRSFYRRIKKARQHTAYDTYENTDWGEWLKATQASLIPGVGYFLQDTPAHQDTKNPRLLDILRERAGPTEKELIISTPYLIPARGFMERVRARVSEGIDVRIITGSLGSNNHTIAHSHYKKYRKHLINAGVKLFEFHHQPPQDLLHFSDAPAMSSKSTSLHAKAAVADRKLSFIGSLNVDPRAIDINTENGILIASPTLAEQLAQLIERMMEKDSAWEVLSNEHGTLYWESLYGTTTIQPGKNFWQRCIDAVLAYLPIEKQL